MAKKTAVSTKTEAALVVRSAASALKALPTAKVIKNQPEFEQASLYRTRAKAELKTLKAKKDAILVPLNTAMKEVRALFKPVEVDGAAYLETLNDTMTSFVDKQRAKELKAAEKRVDVVGLSKQEKKDILDAAARAKPRDVVGTSVKTVWDYEVVDLQKVPKKFLVLDTGKLRTFLQASNWKGRVSGIKVFQKTQLSDKAS